MLKKIRSNQVKSAAKYLVESFKEYPLYDVFFTNDKEKEIGLYYFSFTRIFLRSSFTYVSEDCKILLSLKRPEDNEKKLISLFFAHPIFSLKMLLSLSKYTKKIIKAFNDFENKIQEQFYNSSNDCYLQMIAIEKSKRTSPDGNFQAILKNDVANLIKGRPIYFETHSKLLKRLYELSGATTVDISNFKGIDCYAMRWEKN